MYKISWITPTYFIDTDLPVVSKLQHIFKIKFIVVIPWYEKNDYESFVRSKIDESVTDLLFIKQKFPYSFLNYFTTKKIMKELTNFNADVYYLSYQMLDEYKKCLDLTKCIIPCHNVTTPKGARNEVKAAEYTDTLLRTFNNIQVFSEFQEKVLKSRYQGKNVLMAPFLLKDYGEPTIQVDRLTEEPIQFLNFGNIVLYKRLDLLIEAVNILVERGLTNFKVKIAGHCKNWQDYEALIKYPDFFDLEIKRIPNEDIPNLFARSQYFVLPYQDIAQSGSMAVAFRYGLPAIVSDIEPFKEFVKDKYNGYSFKSQNAESLADVMEFIIKNHKSIYPSLAINVKEYVKEKYSDAAIVKAYTQYISSICTKK